MSSEVDGVGLIAAPVVLTAAVAFGAGWLAWQGGKLLIEANRAADRQIAENKRKAEEAARHRKMAALAAHSQLTDMCSQIIAQLDVSSIIEFAETQQLKAELKKICEESLPDDAARIESLTSLGYLKLDSIVRRQQRIAAFELSESQAGLYRGLSVADLMDGLRIAIGAMDIKATDGKDVRAADPAVIERAKLNEAFVNATTEIMLALEAVDEMASTYGLTESANAWFRSCFNGVDVLIETLCRPTTSNKELKKGVRRLEDVIKQYELMAPGIERELTKMIALYKVYADVAKGLGENVESFRAFNSADEIEEKLKYLKTRADKADECAAIYRKLGPAAYMCYALDRELQAMGYEVHTRKEITDMASKKPQHAKLGESKLPFYQWDEDELTQLYSISSECSLQVIVHEDGTVSMQTIADVDNAEVVETQRGHCAQVKELHERLKKNWFILYDFEETESPENVTTVAGWRASDEFAWGDSESRGLITDERATKGTSSSEAMRKK